MPCESTVRTDFYSDQIADLSLEDALNVYYAVHPQFTHWSDCRTEILRKMLRSHDISHVIYGCPTTMLGELRVQCWNIFGSKVPKTMKEFIEALRDKETRELLGQPGILKFLLKNSKTVFLVWQQSRKMTKKWHFFKEGEYMARTVGEIRREFGIEIFKL